MSDPSPFVLSPARKLRDIRGFYRTHRRALGSWRGTVAMAGTMWRFIGLRRQLGRSDSPMVDDSVSIAVAMYRSLSGPLGETVALDAVEASIVASGMELMADWVPTDRSMQSLGTQVRLVMGDAEHRGIYGIDDMVTTDTGISWDVTSCRYAALTTLLGSPELGRVFCAVDQPFVSGVLPDLPFSCDTTIARGDDRCRFRVGDET